MATVTRKQPLYDQLVDLLREKIDNELEPGDLLPSERELSERYGLSRTTVRLALKELETMGLITRRHGKGTFVSDSAREATNLMGAYSFTEQMRSLGRVPKTVILDFKVLEATKTVAEHLRLHLGETVFRMRRLRLADEVPMMVEQTYLPASEFAGLTKAIVASKPLYDIMEQALEQARRGRMHIMDIITETMPAPRPDLKPHAPRIVSLTIDKDQIGALIGPGGKIIQDIQEKSGTVINIEEVDGKGIVDVAASNKQSIDIALQRIRAIVAKPEVGEVYDGVVKSIMPFGAFVEILPGKDGLLHVSELDHRRIEHVEDVLKEGDHIQVKLLEIDPKTGKLRLSHKALMPKPEGRGDRNDRGGRRR